jgi:predicted amidohydrolase
VLRIALIQLQLQNNKTKAIEHALKLLNKVGSSDSDIVCLPELWYTKTVTNFEKEFNKIIDIAKEYNMAIIPGAFVERRYDDINNCNSALQISTPVIANDT